MKPIAKRLQRVEQWISSQQNAAGETPADVLRARIRRLAEAEGRSFELPPGGRRSDDAGRAVSVAEILRRR